MPRSHAIAIDLGRRRLRALLAQRDGGLLRVKKILLRDVPDEVSIDEAEAYGAWVGSELSEAGFPRGARQRATVALAREHVGLKRIHLPTTDGYELPEMTRLAMQRELPFDAATAVIDFVSLHQDERSTTVLAVAAPRPILEHTRQIAAAARLGIERISLRSMGSALILRHLGEDISGAVLAVDITKDAVEFCVVEKGAVRFSRAAELGADIHPELVSQAVVTETRRTWMSYRIAEGTAEVQHVLVMGERRVCEEVAEPLAEMLRVRTEVLHHHPLVESKHSEISRVWPLAGLLLESGHGGGTIDFAHPRKAPDRRSARRRRTLVAAGLALVVFFGLWTLARRDLQSLEAQLSELQSQQRTLQPEYLRYNRDGFKLRHLQHWEEASVDWLAHLQHLASLLPPADQVVLEGWQGAQQFRGVEFDRQSREWSAPMLVTINVDGEARDRATADAFREALVQADVYATSSTGADAAGGRRLPFGFAYRLRTDAGSPDAVMTDGGAGEGGG